MNVQPFRILDATVDMLRDVNAFLAGHREILHITMDPWDCGSSIFIHRGSEFILSGGHDNASIGAGVRLALPYRENAKAIDAFLSAVSEGLQRRFPDAK
jgi:hypothetical protein